MTQAPPPPKPTPPPAQPLVRKRQGKRVMIYGTPGIGKTTLAAACPGTSKWFDLDRSLDDLGIDAPTETAASWDELLTKLATPVLWQGVDNIVIDTATRAEQLHLKHMLTRDGKGDIEQYGFGKGYRVHFDGYISLYAALDMHIAEGRNVILIAHDEVGNVPNPSGDDWIRYEPRLQARKEANLRGYTNGWVGELWFISRAVTVDKEGKGKGHGPRTLYSEESPGYLAKSRTFSTPYQITTPEERAAVWALLLNR